MTAVNFGRAVFEGVRTGGLARAAAAKFAGSWFACLIVMARGNIFAAFSADHLLRATVCGTVGALFTVALLAQMDRSLNSVSRQATLSAVVTLIGDVFAHPSHFGPQWAEPVVTAAVSAGIAVAAWYIRQWMRSAKNRILPART
ncbi:MAG: hypothetical protein WA268_20445 [Xanthobacteraceae bacterium]